MLNRALLRLRLLLQYAGRARRVRCKHEGFDVQDRSLCESRDPTAEAFLPQLLHNFGSHSAPVMKSATRGPLRVAVPRASPSRRVLRKVST